MKTYTDNQTTLTDSSGAHIPKDPRNTDYSRVLAEVQSGKAEIVAPPPAPPAEDMAAAYSRQVLAVVADALSAGVTIEELIARIR